MEKDVFNHLIDIENSASHLVLDAQAEADKRISVAKANADKCIKQEYDKIIAGFEDNFIQESQAIKVEREQEYKKYEEQLNSLPKNKIQFVEFLDHYFFGSNKNG